MYSITLFGKPVFANIKQILARLRVDEEIYFKMEDVGDSVMINCPFHNDRTPSLGIAKKEINKSGGIVVPVGTVNCFGCGYSANFIKFISDIKNCDEKDAIRWLRNNFEVGEYKEREINFSLSRNKNDDSVEDIKEYFQYSVSYPEYLKERGINKETALKYLVKETDNNTILFPVTKLEGEIIGYQERKVDEKKFYSHGDVNRLYGLHLLDRRSKVLWLVEGPIDCMVANMHGKNVVAVLGSLSDSKINEIRKLSYPVLMCAFDNDEAGDKYADIIANEFDNSLIGRIFFKGGDDPGDIPHAFKYSKKFMK